MGLDELYKALQAPNSVPKWTVRRNVYDYFGGDRSRTLTFPTEAEAREYYALSHPDDYDYGDSYTRTGEPALVQMSLPENRTYTRGYGDTTFRTVNPRDTYVSFSHGYDSAVKAPWASETPATWSDGSPIGDVPDWLPEDPYEGFAVSDFYRNRNLGDDNPLGMPVQQHRNYDPWVLKHEGDDPYMWFDGLDPTNANPLEMPNRQRYNSPLHHWRGWGPEGITGYDLEPSTPWLIPYDDYVFSESKGIAPVDFYDDLLSDARRAHELQREGFGSVDMPFYDAMLEDERTARLLADYGIGTEEFVPELPVSKFTTDFRTDPSFLKLDSVDDALLMGSPYGADDYLAGLSSFTPGKMPVNAMDDVFDLAKSSAKAGKRAGSGLAASFRKLKNII